MDSKEEVYFHDNGFLDCCLPKTTIPLNPAHQFSLVILNSEVGPYFHGLWNQAQLTLCADGGVNRVFDYVPATRRADFVPSVVIGDLDSAKKEVLTYYTKLGTKVVRVANQETTDLQKSLVYLSKQRAAGVLDADSVVVYGAFGGRFDQEINAIHTLYKYSDLFNRIILLKEGNLCELLKPGKHIYTCHPALEGLGTNCGLIPFGGEVRELYTQGLKWNLVGDSLSFMGNISTSNVISNHTLTIMTSDHLVLTTSCGARVMNAMGYEEDAGYSSFRTTSSSLLNRTTSSSSSSSSSNGSTSSSRNSSGSNNNAIRAEGSDGKESI